MNLDQTGFIDICIASNQKARNIITPCVHILFYIIKTKLQAHVHLLLFMFCNFEHFLKCWLHARIQKVLSEGSKFENFFFFFFFLGGGRGVS